MTFFGWEIMRLASSSSRRSISSSSSVVIYMDSSPFTVMMWFGKDAIIAMLEVEEKRE